MNSIGTTETKILISARKTFLKYGFHATTMQKIATEANVNKTIIHYYFRTKNNLYNYVIQDVADIILENNKLNSENFDILLFIINEMNNNKIVFLNSLNNYAENNWFLELNNYIENELTNFSRTLVLNLNLPKSLKLSARIQFLKNQL